MIYPDTHVLVWLYQKAEELITPGVRARIESSELLVSPMAILELEYLFEIKRITETGRRVFDHLAEQIELRVCQRTFYEVVRRAAGMRWTRDPFDRLITAQASLEDAPLLTRDRTIHSYYPQAVWD
jgi:PIN domain nuclease of toxin-antitoxin system